MSTVSASTPGRVSKDHQIDAVPFRRLHAVGTCFAAYSTRRRSHRPRQCASIAGAPSQEGIDYQKRRPMTPAQAVGRTATVVVPVPRRRAKTTMVRIQMQPAEEVARDIKHPGTIRDSAKGTSARHGHGPDRYPGVTRAPVASARLLITPFEILEREKGFEPSTPTLAGLCWLGGGGCRTLQGHRNRVR